MSVGWVGGRAFGVVGGCAGRVNVIAGCVSGGCSVAISGGAVRVPFRVVRGLSMFPPSMVSKSRLRVKTRVALTGGSREVFCPSHSACKAAERRAEDCASNSCLLGSTGPFGRSVDFRRVIDGFGALVAALPRAAEVRTLGALVSVRLARRRGRRGLTYVIRFPLSLRRGTALRGGNDLFSLTGGSGSSGPRVERAIRSVTTVYGYDCRRAYRLIIKVGDGAGGAYGLRSRVTAFCPRVTALSRFRGAMLIPFVGSCACSGPLLVSSLGCG